MKGIFKPKHPEKYLGDPTKIRYLSSWELKYFVHVDNDPNTISWASEEVSIPYVSPKDNRVHLYYPDIIIKKLVNGKPKTFMLEIKPKEQSISPVLVNKNGKSKSRRTQLNEVMTFAINTQKWISARKYCADKNWEFHIITEENLGIKY